MENAKLTGWQMFTLTFFYTVGTTWIVLPGKLISDSKQYAWLPAMWSVVFGLLLAMLWLYLSSLYPGKTLVQIALQVLGKWGGGVVSALYVLFFIQIAAWVTRNLGDFMHISLMPNTPLSIFNLSILFVSAYAVVKGVETIAMVNEFFTAYLLAAFWIPYLFMTREWDWRNFLVAYDFDVWTNMITTKYIIAFPYMETIALMMVFPIVKRRLKTAFLLGIGISGVILSICILFAIGILGVNRSAHLNYPIFVIFREMQFSGIVEHLEAVLAVNILLIVCFKLSLSFYCAVQAICQLFNIPKRATVAYPLIWVISAYSLFFVNIVENVAWVEKYLFHYYLLYAVVFPVLLVIGAKIKQRNEPRIGVAPL